MYALISQLSHLRMHQHRDETEMAEDGHIRDLSWSSRDVLEWNLHCFLLLPGQCSKFRKCGTFQIQEHLTSYIYILLGIFVITAYVPTRQDFFERKIVGK